MATVVVGRYTVELMEVMMITVIVKNNKNKSLV